MFRRVKYLYNTVCLKARLLEIDTPYNRIN